MFVLVQIPAMKSLLRMRAVFRGMPRSLVDFFPLDDGWTGDIALECREAETTTWTVAMRQSTRCQGSGNCFSGTLPNGWLSLRGRQSRVLGRFRISYPACGGRRRLRLQTCGLNQQLLDVFTLFRHYLGNFLRSILQYGLGTPKIVSAMYFPKHTVKSELVRLLVCLLQTCKGTNLVGIFSRCRIDVLRRHTFP